MCRVCDGEGCQRSVGILFFPVEMVDGLVLAFLVEIFHCLIESHGVEFRQIGNVEMSSLVLHIWSGIGMGYSKSSFRPRINPTDAITSNITAMIRLTSHMERTLKWALTLLTKYVMRNHHITAPAMMPV